MKGLTYDVTSVIDMKNNKRTECALIQYFTIKFMHQQASANSKHFFLLEFCKPRFPTPRTSHLTAIVEVD